MPLASGRPHRHRGLHDFDQVWAHFPRTLLLAREAIDSGPTDVAMSSRNLLRARSMASWHRSANKIARWPTALGIHRAIRRLWLHDGVLVACLALGLGSAPIGVLLMSHRMSLVGDAMSHDGRGGRFSGRRTLPDARQWAWRLHRERSVALLSGLISKC